jgi:hypothetical protein
MKTLQFEAVKVAMKQDKTGYVLTTCIHPDEVPEDLLRDWVGARYQVVMVRLDAHEQPMDRQDEFSGEKSVRQAGILSRDQEFWSFLVDLGEIFDKDQESATEWLRDYLGVKSRAELKTNESARQRLQKLNKEFSAWKEK